MEEILDIYVYYTNFDEMYDLDNSFYGRVLKKENQIEGLIKEYGGHQCFFVYGSLDNENISMIQCPKNERLCHRYDAKKDGSKFYGTFSATDGVLDIPVGECQVAMIPAEKTRETTTFEINGLKRRIELFQESLPEKSRQNYNLWKLQQKNKQLVKK